MLKTARVSFTDNDEKTYDYFFDDSIIKNVTDRSLVLVTGGGKFSVARVKEVLNCVTDKCTKPLLGAISLDEAFNNRVEQESIMVEEMLK